MATASEILQALKRTTETIIGESDLVELLDSGRQLRIKFGVDCTAPDLHIGHAVNLWMMRRLQDAGHRVVFLLGDLTTRIGDPTGKSETRPILTTEEIDANAAAFLDQVSLVLDTSPTVFEVRRNSEWFDSMDVAALLSLCSMVTHAQLMARDMFRERVAEGREIALHELTYPVLQGYDSFAMDSDLTIVGSDQLFNESMGRHFQQRLGAKPQVVITTTITPGLDGGPKQSKSLSNYVALRDSPENKFGKLMSLTDGLVGRFAAVYTDLPIDRVQELEVAATIGGTAARDAKLFMAEGVVSRYHGPDVASSCRRDFIRVFSEREHPDMEAVQIPHAHLTVLELVRAALPHQSNSERRRLIT
ncbi:tyrosine--tRNA ligase [Arthrobacter tumbae]|uniref:tyrosine--tRNA ligase n=1 Tax=Arthrobacter tumbae TaxID=163874 RepID=UPI00195DD356|nr:tyrosine--tRNA ligase [Arthrobacter tumbae]